MHTPSRQRLEFQAQAASVQQEASRLILFTTALFGRVFSSHAWPDGADASSEALSARGAAVADAWRKLEPTRTLEHDWRELVTLFDILARMFDEVAALGRFTGPALVERTRSLQADFTRHLERMNRIELRLLESEEMLRDRADAGMEDE